MCVERMKKLKTKFAEPRNLPRNQFLGYKLKSAEADYFLSPLQRTLATSPEIDFGASLRRRIKHRGVVEQTVIRRGHGNFSRQQIRDEIRVDRFLVARIKAAKGESLAWFDVRLNYCSLRKKNCPTDEKPEE